MVGATRECAPQIRLLTRAAIVVTIFVASSSVAVAEQFEVPRRDLPAMRGLATQTTALSPTVDPQEASQLAQCV